MAQVVERQATGKAKVKTRAIGSAGLAAGHEAGSSESIRRPGK